MKHLLALLLVAMVATLAACTPKELPPSTSEAPSHEESLPDPSTPAGAVTELFESAKQWDLETVQAHLPKSAAMPGELLDAFRQPIEQVLHRMQYHIGDVTQDEATAAVALEITSVDAGSALQEAAGAVAAHVAKEKLAGRQIDDYATLLQTAMDAVDIDKLPTKSFPVTVYLFKGNDSEWKINLDDKRNLPLLNAVTGGALDLANQVEELTADLGVSLP